MKIQAKPQLNLHKSDTNLPLLCKQCHFWWSKSIKLDINAGILIDTCLSCPGELYFFRYLSFGNVHAYLTVVIPSSTL